MVGKKIKDALENYYSPALQIPGIAVLVLSDKKKIMSLNLAAVQLFDLDSEAVALEERLDIFLPEYMRGKAHDNMVDGAFAGFRLAIERKSADLAMRAMSSRVDGEPREVDALTFGRSPLKIRIKLAPLPVEGVLYIAAFIQNAGGSAPFEDVVTEGSSVVITNGRLLLVSEAGSVVGRQFTGIFGFFVNQVFGASRLGRISSAITTFLTLGSLVYAALWAFDSKFGTKPTIFNLPISGNETAPPSGGNQEPPSNSP